MQRRPAGETGKSGPAAGKATTNTTTVATCSLTRILRFAEASLPQPVCLLDCLRERAKGLQSFEHGDSR